MKVSLEEAALSLNSGRVVAVPTETVYGLAASLAHPEAISEIFSIKGRPSNNPLIVHLASWKEIIRFSRELPPHFASLAEAFWPGPLTLILPVIQEAVSSIARAGLATAGFRVPDHELTRELLRETGPLVMPSANLSGKPSATSTVHVEEDFGKDFPVLDGGECVKGVESTILCWDLSAWVVIRLGALVPEDFFPVLGYVPIVKDRKGGDQAAPLCPGQIYRHYSPKAKLLLSGKIQHEAAGNKDELVIVGFADRHYPVNSRLFSMGNSYDPDAAAHDLYAVLRKLDAEYIEQALVDMDFPKEGLWMTLRERLHKAASP